MEQKLKDKTAKYKNALSIELEEHIDRRHRDYAEYYVGDYRDYTDGLWSDEEANEFYKILESGKLPKGKRFSKTDREEIRDLKKLTDFVEKLKNDKIKIYEITDDSK